MFVCRRPINSIGRQIAGQRPAKCRFEMFIGLREVNQHCGPKASYCVLNLFFGFLVQGHIHVVGTDCNWWAPILKIFLLVLMEGFNGTVKETLLRGGYRRVLQRQRHVMNQRAEVVEGLLGHCCGSLGILVSVIGRLVFNFLTLFPEKCANVVFRSATGERVSPSPLGCCGSFAEEGCYSGHEPPRTPNDRIYGSYAY